MRRNRWNAGCSIIFRSQSLSWIKPWTGQRTSYLRCASIGRGPTPSRSSSPGWARLGSKSAGTQERATAERRADLRTTLLQIKRHEHGSHLMTAFRLVPGQVVAMYPQLFAIDHQILVLVGLSRRGEPLHIKRPTISCVRRIQQVIARASVLTDLAAFPV